LVRVAQSLKKGKQEKKKKKKKGEKVKGRRRKGEKGKGPKGEKEGKRKRMTRRARALRVLSLRCSGCLFAALARHAPIVGARGVSVGSPPWSERSSCFHQNVATVFSVGGMSIHSNFSTSAAICARGERGDNRNRVTGEDCTLILTRFGCED